MRLMIAAAAFSSHGAKASQLAAQACAAATARDVELLLLPGLRWKADELQSLSRRFKSLMLCAATAGSAVILLDGEPLLTQPRLYGTMAAGEAVHTYTREGITIAVLAGEDANAPQAARAAAMLGACVLLCPAEQDHIAGAWAQTQQNGVFAAVAPSVEEARIFCPMNARFPEGIMARGRPGSMAIARFDFVDWARGRIARDPFSMLNKAFAAAMPPAGAPEQPPAAPLKVAAAQCRFQPVGGKAVLLERMNSLCRKASEEGCRFIAFPEHIWLDAYGDMPLLKRYAENGDTIGSPSEWELDHSDLQELQAFFPEITSPPRLPLLAHLHLRYGAGSIARFARREIAKLAQTHKIAVHGGTFFERKKKKLYHTSFLVLPDGTAVEQRKLHPTPMERALGVSPGDDLAVYPVENVVCCAPIGSDADFFEPFAAARRAGCDVAVVPSCHAGKHFLPVDESGCSARAKESLLYIVKPAMTGHLLGQMYTGRAAIYSPFDEEGGILAASQELIGEGIVTATLDFEKLRRAHTEKRPENPALDEILYRLYHGDMLDEIGMPPAK